MKKLFFLITSLISTISYAADYCDTIPDDENITVTTNECVSGCSGYMTIGKISFTCANLWQGSQSPTTNYIQKLLEVYKDNSPHLNSYCTGPTDRKVLYINDFIYYHDTPDWKDDLSKECDTFCKKNAGVYSEKETTTYYPTDQDYLNGEVIISNGSTFNCSQTDTTADDACQIEFIYSEVFDGTSITKTTESFLRASDCSTMSDDSLEYTTINLEYCNELGGFYGNNFCDNASPDYFCAADQNCSLTDPDPDGTDPDGTDPDGTDPDGTDPDGTDPDGTGTGGTGETDNSDTDGILAYLKGLFDNFGQGNAAANAKYSQELSNSKSELNNNNNVVDFSNTSFDESGFVSGASCPAPYVLNMSFGTFEIPFDFICEFAEIISFIVLGCAYYVAARIVMGW